MSWWKTKKSKIKEAKLKLRVKKVNNLIDSLLANNCEIYISPISEEFFLLDRKNKLYVTIQYDSLKVSNHDYLFEINVTLSVIEDLKKRIRLITHESIISIKKELFKNEIELLDKISEYYIEK